MVDVNPSVIAMWAHPRAVSTAFLRMMIARGDVTVVHEPWVTLTDEGYVDLPDTDGGTRTVRSPGEVLTHLVKLGGHQTVFVKDTSEYSYRPLFDHADELGAMTHTFIVREPARAIASHHAMKPTVTCPEIGYEHQYELFEFVWRLTGRKPVVISAERLLAEPETVIAAYCSAVGLPYLPEALRWEPSDRAEWHRTRQWHVAASVSSGFQPSERGYEMTVDNHPGLRSYYEYHRPFYERLVQHVIPGGKS